MGVPKFYRWLSERYPCINESVNQYNIPEFDNFYVDMNGVYHICSHPSDDVHFRLSEAQIFENIGIYVEFLFNLVQPRKVFFLSVDGVAPRSKMNQQRSRRFKTAKEAIENEEKAKRLGESLPDDPRFDSNCITPGTEFMHKLHNYMVEFLCNKVQNNQSWREVEVIYSGYDVPGEGEHKIMDYIRYSKTKNTFVKNARHCLYGLDADLINLGLSCHEPYFSLLREEVVFTKNQKRHCDPLKTNFQLLHLSILRDYINKEFEEISTKIKFKYDLEKIIDDWILMNFLIGNDFLPHIPKFHVDKGSIQILYDTYKAVLPTLDGYLNQGGTIQLERYKKYLQKLSDHDMELFSGTSVDLKYFNQDYNNITFGDNANVDEPFEFNNEPIDSDGNSEDKENETLDDDSEEDIEEEFIMHKNNYYKTKLHFEDLEGDVLEIVNEYTRGLQWVLFYYFNGCVSWNWYYPYYYAPYVSDLSKFDINDFKFQQSKPFQPLMQLLAVIPQASKEILPKTFQKLTHNLDSPLIQYFPKEVATDLNEKIHDYEAIILIPFIDEDVLTNAFKMYENELTSDELHRNKFGVHYSLMHSDLPVTADSSLDSKYANVKVIKYSQDHFVLPPEMIYKGINKNMDLKEIIGFPTLNGIHYGIKIDNARLKVFRFASQNPSMLLTIENAQFNHDQLMELAKKQIGQMVYINWPLLSEAKLIELVDTEHKYVLNSKNQVAIEDVSKYELGYAKQSSNSHCSTLRNKKGIILDQVYVMAKVAPLQSQKYIVTGGKILLHKEWSKTEAYIPLELVVFTDRPISKIPVYKSLNTVFTKGKSFFLIDQPYYGYKTDVIDYIKNRNLVKAKVCVCSEPDFGDIMDNYHYILDENYIPENKLIGEIRQRVKQMDSGVRRLLGSVLVSYKADKGREKKMNLGLKLKYKSNMEMNIKPYCIPGYSMVDGNDIFYNRKVISILENYYKKFSCVFEMISSQHKPLFEMDDLFPSSQLDKNEKIKKISEIKDWIDSLELSKIGHFKSDAEYLDNCIVKTIEETIEAHSVLMTEETVVEEYIPPQNFYISEFVLKGSSLPDPKVKFCLFDRVVNIKKCIPVPYGGKGTIIGIYRKNDELNSQRGSDIALEVNNDDQDYLEQLMNSVIEVIFDEPFDGGLKTRSTKSNIYKMQTSWLINITYGLNNAKKVPNFRNNYQPIQNYSRGQPKTSTPNHKVARANKQAINGIIPKANENQNKFNHSENSPFKILSKNSQPCNFNFNPTADEFVPTTHQSNFPSISAPPVTSLPMPSYFPPMPNVTPSNPPNSLNDTLKQMLGLKIGNNNSQTNCATKQPQGPSTHTVVPPMPCHAWIESAKSKSKDKTKKPASIKSMVIVPSKNTRKNETKSQTNGAINGAPLKQETKILPRSFPEPPRHEQLQQPQVAPDNTPNLEPSVSQFFHNAARYQNPNQNYHRTNNYNNRNFNNNRNGHSSQNSNNFPPHTQANMHNNFQYNVSLNQQNTDIKQFIPLAVARNYQHERTTKLKHK